MGGKAIGNDPFAASYDLPLLSVVENYTRYYAEGRSHTARAKRVDLREFLQFLVLHRGAAGPEKLTVKDWDTSAVHGFVEHCLRCGQAPATVARRLATLKHMGRTLAERSPGFINPARDVRPPRLADTKPRALTAQELHDVTQRAHARFLAKQTFIRRRNEVLFHLLLDTGMRADEIRMLKRQQLQHELDWIASVRTKGRRYRNVYVSAVMRPLLRDYLEARTFELKRFFPRLTKSQDEALPLFISTYRAQPQHPETFSMGAKSVWRAVHEIAAELRLHPHLLRHSYATHLLDHAKDIRLVSQALGHSDVRVTMRYTERRDEEVARAVESMRRQKK